MKENTENNSIRPAKPEDYNQVAPLIIQAMEDVACKLIQAENPYDALPLFEKFFQQTSNQYSFDNTLVFVENGIVAGSITGYDGALLEAYRKPFLDYIEKAYDVRHDSLEDETQAGEYYIDTLSVSDKFQGKGIGSKLIKKLIVKAGENGYSKVGLLVDQTNPLAKKLYTRLGFKVEKTITFANGIYEHMQYEIKNTP
ncbi:GNAT family N-acetyltransferase [Zhouia spongiae]|uniref:GNAT family N-acetyltransferase n=1 Tax=Zhouia spongiae TaxID=2202721 RepID=A0ABY3YJ65_9FLAO|nr:GNAT family N-acetyltransferase [Zhouia spongiae]UNY97864.1 GNAT family N-acetyltransferase [Zhouia spongiae]